ncbi:MAG: GspH/FimT family pseudopilin [bacterium]
MTRARRHREGEEGFSLLEAVLVLVLMAIVLAAAFGGPSLIANRRLAGAARDLGGELRWVEQRARAERRCWRVVFDPAGELYHIHFLAGGSWTASGGCTGGTWTAYTASGPRALARSIDLFSTTFGSDTMTVSPFGNPNGGTVVLQSPNGEQRRVIVNVLGRVLITR